MCHNKLNIYGIIVTEISWYAHCGYHTGFFATWGRAANFDILAGCHTVTWNENNITETNVKLCISSEDGRSRYRPDFFPDNPFSGEMFHQSNPFNREMGLPASRVYSVTATTIDRISVHDLYLYILVVFTVQCTMQTMQHQSQIGIPLGNSVMCLFGREAEELPGQQLVQLAPAE